MAVLNPDHLFEQAEKLITSSIGTPRQVDLRRAISAAYYGVFHAISIAAADYVIGHVNQGSPQYALAYRSIGHKTLLNLCREAKKPKLPPKFVKFEPSGGFSDDIRAFSVALVELQERRHTADYDPSIRVTTDDARLAIQTARSAAGRLQTATGADRVAFLALLLFPPRP